MSGDGLTRKPADATAGSGGDAPLLIVAGEASGDLHGARMLAELRRLRPGLDAFGLGGDALDEVGFDALASSHEVAVVGITEALEVLPRAKRIFDRLVAESERRRPAGAVLIDSPEFNLRLAAALGRLGIPVVYYISPQVWAWRSGRVKKIARLVKKMMVLFPFEVEFYRRRGVDATLVGHPLVDEVPAGLDHVWDEPDPTAGGYRIALLPGSRGSEIERLLPILLGAAKRIATEHRARFVLVRAPTVAEEALAGPTAASGLDIEIVSNRRFERLARCHLALCASGTATLEVGLVGTPMLVVYRVGFWSEMLGRLLVRLPHMSLVNLVLEDRVVPELMQRDARPETIAAQAVALLGDRERLDRTRARLGDLRERLGERGASRRAAREVAATLYGEAAG